jgi:hypothetical protein
MSISKLILFGLSLTHAFITPYNLIKPPKLSRCTLCLMNKNSSQIFRTKYELYNPKMTDYDLALVKFFIYGVVINVYVFSFIYSSIK